MGSRLLKIYENSQEGENTDVKRATWKIKNKLTYLNSIPDCNFRHLDFMSSTTNSSQYPTECRKAETLKR